jgi:hypothetical protein
MLRFAWIGLSLWASVAAQPRSPVLFLRLNTTRGQVTLGPTRVTEAPNDQRLSLQICIQAATAADRIERPEIQALNQAPGYFEARPPANIALSVRRGRGTEQREVPFRVYSSGSGTDLTVSCVSADIDFLEEKEVRLKRAAQFIDWIAASGQEGSRSGLVVGNGGLAGYFEEQYINNPPGDYEIVARYSPSTPQNWKGALNTPRLPIRITNHGDFFETLKVKVGAGRH